MLDIRKQGQVYELDYSTLLSQMPWINRYIAHSMFRFLDKRREGKRARSLGSFSFKDFVRQFVPGISGYQMRVVERWLSKRPEQSAVTPEIQIEELIQELKRHVHNPSLHHINLPFCKRQALLIYNFLQLTSGPGHELIPQKEIASILSEISKGCFDATEVMRDGLSSLVIDRDCFISLIAEGCKIIKKGPPY